MAVLVSDMHIVELSPFQALQSFSQHSLDYLSRRYLTLVANPIWDEMRGGSGQVVKVSNCYGETFAMKTVIEPQASDPTNRELLRSAQRRAFAEELRAHRSVSNVSGIPQLHGSGSFRGEPAVLMEWVDGLTLDAAVSLFPLDSDGRGHSGRLVAAIGLAVTSILLEAQGHSPGFVHRDISLRNVMLRGEQRDIKRQMSYLSFDACLIDMGSSLAPQGTATNITMGSDIWRFGTPEYAAPEMLTRDVQGVERLRQSPAVDVYALCSVLYELYAGYPPYDMGNNQRRLGLSPYMMKSQFGPIALVARSPMDVPLVRLISSGIVPEQSARIALHDLHQGLCGYLGRSGPTAGMLREAGARLPQPAPVNLGTRPLGQGGYGVFSPLPPALTSAMTMPSRSRGILRGFN